MTSMLLEEKVGSAFDATKLWHAQQKTWELVHAIAAKFESGMSELEGHAIANELFQKFGSERKWHATKIRFGENTLKSFNEDSDPAVRLKQDDLFFVDIGPVFEGHEGDAGATFAQGADPLHAKAASHARILFKQVETVWRAHGWTGRKLYDFATQSAQDLGWQLTREGASGHRLSDFPHAVHHRGALSKLNASPSPDAWILEIQIRHPERPFGAFFEDLLR